MKSKSHVQENVDLLEKNNDLYLRSVDFFKSFNTSDIRFFVNLYNPGYIAVHNSFLIGSQTVLLDDLSQLDHALSFFKDSTGTIKELTDIRFPKTYGDEYNAFSWYLSV
ncbi:MAG: hypothetical protein WCS55_07810 [Sulfuricurvum sp.]|uniref:hypothetical protein n=1 Tax=Sulfuricurvum sp. TaxID=2025608 RepID=UPI00356AE60D